MVYLLYGKLGKLLQHVVLVSGTGLHRIWLLGSAFFLWAVYAAGCLFYAYRQDPWSHGDWLISYSGGFIRRGLMGEAVFQLSALSGAPVAWIVLGIQILASSIFFFGLARMLLPKDITLGHLAVLLNPLSVGYVLVDPATAGRKEILLFALVVIWQRLETRNSALSVAKGVLGITLGLITFSHEGLYFFIPLFLIVSILAKPTLSTQELAQRLLILIGPATLALVSIVAIKSSATSEQLCSRLITNGYTAYTCEGAVSAAVVGNADGAISTLAWLIRFPASYFLYLGFLFSFIVLAIAVAQTALAKTTKAESSAPAVVLLVTLLMTTPIFLIAVDWGRFVHVVVVIVSIGVLSIHTRKRDVASDVNMSKSQKTLLMSCLASFLSLGVSVSDGQPRSVLGNAFNIGYFLQGGLTPGIFG